MSTIKTLSVFYYGTTVTVDNNKIAFKELSLANPELIATIDVGDYTLEEYAKAWKDALNLAGALDYAVTVNRDTRRMTVVSTGGSHALLSLTGSISGTAAWTMGGWSTASDTSLATSHTSANGAGYEYRPQMILDKYVDVADFKIKESGVVNISTAGVIQTLQFGDGARCQMNIRAITNILNLYQFGHTLWYENLNGYNDAHQFMTYLITKAKVEFMRDVDDRASFVKLILDGTKESQAGIAYQLYNMTRDFYETDVLKFRKALQ